VSGIPEIQGEYSPTFKRVIVAGVFGTVQPLGLETAIYSEERKIDRVITTEPMSTNRMMLKRVVECELIFDPMQMKTFHKLLMGQGGPKHKPGQKIYDDLQLDDAENDQTTNR
jgi:hypothetical protein